MELLSRDRTFTQLVVSSKQRDGVWKRWPPRAGEAFVL
jgi:hypothetical protein